jgi:phosphatidylinositol alpha-1,6-mannosyltransferase
MKILLFTLEYPPTKGGVSKVYENIVKHWVEPDNIFVLHNNDPEHSGLINNNLPFLKWLPAVWQFFKIIKKEKIDHVLVGQILPLGTVAYIVSKFIKIKYTIILHGMDFTFALKTARKKWLAGKILKNAENIICMNNYVAGLVKEFVGVKEAVKVAMVNPGVENHIAHSTEHITKLRHKYNLENKIVLFSMGRLVKRKGVDMVLKSLPEALKVAPNLVYVIGGGGVDEEYLKNLAQNTPLIKGAGGIIFLGKISDEEKWEWFNLCDIFIMPSRDMDGDFEGFGIVLMEANSVGKPVIAGDSGGISDAVENGFNGLLVDPNDKNDIIYAITKLAKDKELREKLGRQGRERAENKFNWEGQVGKIFNLITRNS